MRACAPLNIPLLGAKNWQLLALIGKNRAEGIGKYAEAQVFAEWLKAHLAVPPHASEPSAELATAEEATCSAEALTSAL